ncbi:hypothetical protein LZ30DRAFT_729556 [Colletotrichum cereale]|nr:hypothetical protein LZ30DRAFT_729556 [Colletotrichum cereale]
MALRLRRYAAGSRVAFLGQSSSQRRMGGAHGMPAVFLVFLVFFSLLPLLLATFFPPSLYLLTGHWTSHLIACRGALTNVLGRSSAHARARARERDPGKQSMRRKHINQIS